MKPKQLISFLLFLGATLSQNLETITEAELQQLIQSGQIELATAQSVQEVQQGTAEVAYGSEVYYARPFIAQTQEVVTQPLVEQKVVN